MSRNKLTINQTELTRFKQVLNQKLLNALAIEGVDTAREYTPIWSQRLHNSARAENPQVERDRVHCDLVFGGVALPGVQHERGIIKDVDYALQQEQEKGFLTGNLDAIGQAIVVGLTR